jgi:hypothetical protein
LTRAWAGLRSKLQTTQRNSFIDVLTHQQADSIIEQASAEWILDQCRADTIIRQASGLPARPLRFYQKLDEKIRSWKPEPILGPQGEPLPPIKLRAVADFEREVEDELANEEKNTELERML